MATTTPNNIWTPDSGDDYALTTDLAAMADTVQDALDTKSNTANGTTAQMNAALASFPDGTVWWNTTTNSEWRRVSGAWVNQDTGWISPTIGSGWSVNVVQYCRLNGVVYLQGEFWDGVSGSELFTLPPGFRPASRFSVMIGRGYFSTSYNQTGNLTMQPDGVVSFTQYTGVMPTGSPGYALAGISFRAS